MAMPIRMTADIEGDFVVFVIGLHINKPAQVHRWWSAVRAGRHLDALLRRDPASGLLNSRLVIGARGPMFVQVWRGFDDLERFARATDGPHRAAWAAFNRAAGRSGEVGLWHETYLVPAARYEAVYLNTPAVGLAAAGTYVPIARRGDTARERVSGDSGAPRPMDGDRPR
jgi:Domain of unknown function (DUF4188)